MSDDERPVAAPREAASVILLRERGSGEAEVFLLRRHRRSSFMGSAFVFPGGAVDPGEVDAREAAVRELFEEAGVLLARGVPDAETVREWRRRLLADEALLPDLLADGGAALDLDALVYFAHWVTPSAERKRFSARFFVAALPQGQVASCDDRETVEAIWVTPDEALERAGDLRLPPPQVRTFHDMREAARRGVDAVLELARERAAHAHPVLPRLAPRESGFALLLPWDPEYMDAGTGEAIEMPADHPLATGPSRFVFEDTAWKHVHAPSSPKPE